MRQRFKMVMQGLFVLLLTGGLFFSVAPRGAVRAEPEPVAPTGIPTISFEGFGIGAHLNDPKYPEGQTPPQTTWNASLKADVFDHLYYAGETAHLTVTIANPNTATAAVSVGGKVVVVSVEEGTLPDQGIQIIPTEVLKTVDVPVAEVAVGGKRDVAFDFAGSQNGVYAVYTQFSDGVNAATVWQGNIGYIFHAAEGFKPNSYFMGDTRSVGIRGKDLELATMEKMGVKWSRGGDGSWATVQPSPNVWDWRAADDEVNVFKKYHTYMLYLGGSAPDWTRDYENVSRDVSPRPTYYGPQETFYYRLISRYKDIIRGVNVWNEPWEDSGISGWESSAQHYRNLSRAAWEGVKLADPTALVGGNDSHDNIYDSMLSSTEWPELFDLMTYHGSAANATGFYVGQLANLPLWNTEAWYISQSAYAVQSQIINIASGADKANIFAVGNFFSGDADSGGYYWPSDDPQQFSPQPGAISYNTMTHFLEDTTYQSQLHPGHTPYTYIFKGNNRYVAVVYGVPSEVNSVPLSQVKKHSTMRLPDGSSAVSAYDKYGNPYTRATDGSYTLPYSEDPIYVQASSLDQLNTALNGVTVQDTNPVQVTLHDLTTPLDQQPELRISLTNGLPQDLTGSAEVTLPTGWQAEATQLPLGTLKPGEKKDYTVKLLSAPAGTVNSYPVEVKVTTPFGVSDWKENIEVHLIAKGTPSLTADFDSEVARLHALPIQVGALTDSVNGQVALTYDDDNLYLLAKVTDPTDNLVTDPTGPWFDMFPYNYIYSVDPQWPFNGDHIQLAIDSRANADDYLFPANDPQAQFHPQRTTDYLFEFLQTKQNTPRVWEMHQPGTSFRDRYPFSPADQGVAPGAKISVTRAGNIIQYASSIPLSLIPDFKQRATVKLAVKIGDGWGGPSSNWGRSSGQVDPSVFQPHWGGGYSVGTEWGFTPTRPASMDVAFDNIANRVTFTQEDSLGGLRADYYDDPDFNVHKLQRKDAQVNFDWNSSAPITIPIDSTFGHLPENMMEPDTFSVRWQGQLLARFSEEYTFKADTDGAVRLWVNGKKVIDTWYHPENPLQGTVKLEAGKKYSFKFEYKHQTGPAHIRLYWSSASQLLQVIPQKQYTAPAHCCSTAITPKAPQYLYVTTGKTSVTLDWTMSFRAASYVVKRGDSPNGPFVPIAYDVKKPHYVDTHLETGHPYYYVIVAKGYEDTGISGDSQPVRALPSLLQVVEAEYATVLPNACVVDDAWASNGEKVGCTDSKIGSGVTFTQIDGGKGGNVILGIRYATGAENVTKTLTINGVSQQVAFPRTSGFGGSETAYTVLSLPATLKAGKTNTISITHGESDLNGVDIDALWISPVDTQVPTVPTNVKLQSRTNTTLSLNWSESTDNVGVVAYRVYDGDTLLGSSNTGFPALTLTGLLPGQTYNLVVRAVDVAGNLSTPSAVLTVKTEATPINLKANVVSGGNIQLDWVGAVGDGITYNVKRTNTPGGPYTVIAQVTTTSYLDTSVTTGQYYFYVVTATTSEGESGNSNEVGNTGIRGEYYDNIDFTDLKTTRTDATIDFDWGGIPDGTALTDGDNFTVRWTGQILPQYSEEYTFYTMSDDGVRLWINGQLIIDNWTDHGPTENRGTITLQAGQMYSIKMEFYEKSGGATAKLSWSSASQPRQTVPQSRLFPPVS